MTLKDVVNNVMVAINNHDTEEIIQYYESDAVIKMDMALFSKFNENEKITAEHRYYNVAGLMEHLGL